MKKLIGFLLVLCMLAGLISCAPSYSPTPDRGDSASGSDSGGGYLSGMPGINGSISADKGESSFDDGMIDMEGDSVEGDADVPGEDAPSEDKPEDKPEEKPEENIKLPSGMITAGAQNDNQYYKAWLDLFAQGNNGNGKFYHYTNSNYSWGYNSLNRVKVTVKNGDNPIAGATVVASDEQGNGLFSAVTDAEGNAYLFPTVNNGNITVTCGDESVHTSFTAEERNISVELTDAGNKLNVIEIMLVVDVTGSMGDEIDFLKAELADVINRIAANDSETVIKLAMLFYRDTDDKIPFNYYDFTDVTDANGLASQQAALNEQSASGGGDYPEAVDVALDMAVNKQWSTGATTKIIFQVLDAPAHEGKEYADKLVNATKTAAEKGIRICPIICSGAAQSTEYTMREAAIYTGGTFIFVTDDSGIGGSHHDPELPNVTVELLNSLMVRLVKGYHTGNFEDPIYWKQDPNLGTN